MDLQSVLIIIFHLIHAHFSRTTSLRRDASRVIDKACGNDHFGFSHSALVIRANHLSAAFLAFFGHPLK